MEWMTYCLAVLTGLATAIPLVMKLVEYVKAAAKEKNWSNLVTLVMSLMEQAEKLLETGADKKAWVVAMVKGSADTINYEIDSEVLSELIDNLCEMSKVVNATKSKEDGEDQGE